MNECSTKQGVDVLLVEDNADHAELILGSLEDHPLETHVTHLVDGEQAVQYLLREGDYADRARRSCPDLILLDIRLPKLNGFEVLQEIQHDAEAKNIPVIILTTSGSGTDIADAFSHNVKGYLVKPLDYDEYNQIMNELGFYPPSKK